MKKKLFIFVLLMILLVGIVKAQPASQVFFGNLGYEIKFAIIDNVLQNEDFDFHFHVFNLSNGMPIDNSTTSCFFHLYNNSGNHILILNDIPFGNQFDFEASVDGNNFSDLGMYSYIIQCNDTIHSLGGFSAAGFDVLENVNESNSNPLYIIIGLIGIAAFYLLLSFKIEGTGIKEFFLGLTFIQVLLILFFLLQHQLGKTLINLLRINFISNILIIFGISLIGLWRLMINLMTPGKGGEVEEVKWRNP